MSPAQIVFARKLKDAVPVRPGDYAPREVYILTAKVQEGTIAKRHLTIKEDLKMKTKVLSQLVLGTVVQVQNQHGPCANKCDLSRIVAEYLGHNLYHVCNYGNGRITKRNRKIVG